MEKIIYIYPANQASEFNHRLIEDQNFHGEVEMIPIPGRSDVAAMATTILRRLGEGNTIRKLRVMSHGTFGTALIGVNITASNVGGFNTLRGRFSANSEGAFFHGCRIASDNSPTFGTHIATLSCSEIDSLRTSPTAGMSFEDHMRGTWTVPTPPPPPPESGASYTVGRLLPVGYRFMWLAAIAMNVPVTAPIDRQFAHIDANGFDDSGWEGHYVTVNPNGTNSGEQLGMAFHRIYRAYCPTE